MHIRQNFKTNKQTEGPEDSEVLPKTFVSAKLTNTGAWLHHHEQTLHVELCEGLGADREETGLAQG